MGAGKSFCSVLVKHLTQWVYGWSPIAAPESCCNTIDALTKAQLERERHCTGPSMNRFSSTASLLIAKVLEEEGVQLDSHV